MSVLSKKAVDRPPVIIPGGMMNAAVAEILAKSGLSAPGIHLEAKQMAKTAKAVHDLTGIENYGVPFCMTVEAEAMGSAIELGDNYFEPRVVKEVFTANWETGEVKKIDPARDGRTPVVLEAVSILRADSGDIPVVGNLTGPISLAASLIEVSAFMRLIFRNPSAAHSLLSVATDNLVSFGSAMIAAGADVIAIADPTASGEILGPRHFAEFAFPYLSRLTAALSPRAPIIIHICGDITVVMDQIAKIEANAVSFDAVVGLQKVRSFSASLVLMGNVSTFLLANGPVTKIKQSALNKLENKIDILAPACGLSTKTPVEHIRALTQAVKES